MGEEMKLGAGVLYLDGKPIMDVQEVPEFHDEYNATEESYKAFTLDFPDITATFVAPKHYWSKARKILFGFDRYKGPARYSQIFKHDKMLRKRRQMFEKVVRGINYMTDTFVVSDYPVNITGLPCTDIYEWAWLIVDPDAYSEYRGRKIQRTARSKRRSQRR